MPSRSEFGGYPYGHWGRLMELGDAGGPSRVSTVVGSPWGWAGPWQLTQTRGCPNLTRTPTFPSAGVRLVVMHTCLRNQLEMQATLAP